MTLAKSLTFPVPRFIFIEIQQLTFKGQRRPGPASLPVFMEYRQTGLAQGPRPPSLGHQGLWLVAATVCAASCGGIAPAGAAPLQGGGGPGSWQAGRRLQLRAEAFRPPAFSKWLQMRCEPIPQDSCC